MYQEIKYFKGLNGLRFLAAYLVLMHHAEDVKEKYGLFNFNEYSLFNNGGLAVTFFFVLSGFLITYLLLKEIHLTQDVSIRKFYVRRILRIWPLYYLLVFLGTLVVPFALSWINHPYEMPYQFGEVIWYYVFFAPFMVNIFFGSHLLEPLWSIGVEEIFYILWAPLFKFLKKHVLQIILGVIILRIALLLLLPHLGWPGYLVEAIHLLKFEAMAVGGLFAYGIYHRQRPLEESWWFSWPAQVLILALLAARIVAFRSLPEWSPVFAVLFQTRVVSSLLEVLGFAWLIVNIAVNQGSLIKLGNPVWNYLGDISYGVYMYHMLVIFGMVLLGKDLLGSFSPAIMSGVFYLLVTTVVILMAGLSKKWYEDRFLVLKKKFR